jgi:3-oxocholest-4-en-26-oate---CoA ligase
LVALRGRTSLGYYKDATKTASTFRLIDGVRWSIPGDWATVDSDGAVRLLGRGSQCINTGGEKVFPEEVEETLKTYPAVADAIVVGVPDERFGERIVAAVELVDGTDATEAQLIDHVRAHLADYKAPRRVRILDSIGRSPSGKLDYRRHRDEAATWAGATV